MLSIRKQRAICHREAERGEAVAISQDCRVACGLLAMTVLVFSLLMPGVANAQACPRGLVSCNSGPCTTPFNDAGQSCTDAQGRIGRFDSCGVCSNVACPGGQVFCGAGCQAPASRTNCPVSTNRAYDSCSGCGDCASGFTDCNADPSAYNCLSSASLTCRPPRVYDPCSSACSDPYVFISPSPNPATQTGSFHVSGNGRIGADLYLESGRAIRVDALNSTASWNLGNWATGSQGLVAIITGELTLAPDTNPNEAILRINQNHADGLRHWTGLRLDRRGSERWFLGMNATDDSLLLRRGSSTNDLVIDGSGNLQIAGSARVTGDLIAGRVCFGADCRGAWPVPEGGGGVTDHGALTGLADNDHPQYYLQMGETRDLNVGGNLLLTGSAQIHTDQANGFGRLTIGNYAVGGITRVSVGNVETPLETFTVSDPTAATARIKILDTAQNPELQLQYGPTAFDGSSPHWGLYVNRAQGNSLRIWGAVAGGADRLSIDASGNVEVLGGQLRAPEVCLGSGADRVCRTSWPAAGGTLSDIIAGSGITITGAGATRQVALTPCAAGQVPRHNGINWECASDGDHDHEEYYLQSGETRDLVLTNNRFIRMTPEAGQSSSQLHIGSTDTTTPVHVAIGNTTAFPGETLTVRDDTGGVSQVRIMDTVQNPELQLQYGLAGNQHWGWYVNRPDASKLTLWGAGEGGANRLTVDASGNLELLTGQLRAPEVCLGSGADRVCRTSWPAVGGGATYTAGDYITISPENRISATHDGGCFGPTFVGVTPSSTKGQITSGTLAGYRAAHALCNAAFSGSHMCATSEVLNSISCGADAATSPVFTQTIGTRGWIANGAPALPTQTNDCNGWIFSDASATVNGVAWAFDDGAGNTNGGTGWAQTCDTTYPIACCR